jgi:thiol:disulfide interchange protein DsbD
MSAKMRTTLVVAVVVVGGLMFYVNSRLLNGASRTVPAPTASDNSDKITWLSNLPDALKLSAKTGRPVMADFYADWCGWCKKLDKETYADPDVVKKSKFFVCVKLNADVSRDESARYKVRGLPTIVFLDSDGKLLDQVIGYTDAKNLIGTMSKLMKTK